MGPQHRTGLLLQEIKSLITSPARPAASFFIYLNQSFFKNFLCLRQVAELLVSHGEKKLVWAGDMRSKAVPPSTPEWTAT